MADFNTTSSEIERSPFPGVFGGDPSLELTPLNPLSGTPQSGSASVSVSSKSGGSGSSSGIWGSGSVSNSDKTNKIASNPSQNKSNSKARSSNNGATKSSSSSAKKEQSSAAPKSEDGANKLDSESIIPLKNSEILSPIHSTHSHSKNKKEESQSGVYKKDGFPASSLYQGQVDSNSGDVGNREKKYIFVDETLFDNCVADFAGNAYETDKQKTSSNKVELTSSPRSHSELSLKWLVILLYGLFTAVYSFLVYFEHSKMNSRSSYSNYVISTSNMKNLFWFHCLILIFAPTFTSTSIFEKYIAISKNRVTIYNITSAIHLSYVILIMEAIVGPYAFISYLFVAIPFRIITNNTVFDNLAITIAFMSYNPSVDQNPLLHDAYQIKNVGLCTAFALGLAMFSWNLRTIEEISKHLRLLLLLRMKLIRDRQNYDKIIRAHIPDFLMNSLNLHSQARLRQLQQTSTNEGIIDNFRPTLLQAAFEKGIIYPAKTPTINVELLKSHKDMKQFKNCVIVAFKQIILKDQDEIGQTRSFALFDIIDLVAKNRNIQSIRRFGDIWIGCIGLKDSDEPPTEENNRNSLNNSTQSRAFTYNGHTNNTNPGASNNSFGSVGGGRGTPEKNRDHNRDVSGTSNITAPSINNNNHNDVRYNNNNAAVNEAVQSIIKFASEIMCLNDNLTVKNKLVAAIDGGTILGGFSGWSMQFDMFGECVQWVLTKVETLTDGYIYVNSKLNIHRDPKYSGKTVAYTNYQNVWNINSRENNRSSQSTGKAILGSHIVVDPFYMHFLATNQDDTRTVLEINKQSIKDIQNSINWQRVVGDERVNQTIKGKVGASLDELIKLLYNDFALGVLKSDNVETILMDEQAELEISLKSLLFEVLANGKLTTIVSLNFESLYALYFRDQHSLKTTLSKYEQEKQPQQSVNSTIVNDSDNDNRVYSIPGMDDLIISLKLSELLTNIWSYLRELLNETCFQQNYIVISTEQSKEDDSAILDAKGEAERQKNSRQNQRNDADEFETKVSSNFGVNNYDEPTLDRNQSWVVPFLLLVVLHICSLYIVFSDNHHFEGVYWHNRENGGVSLFLLTYFVNLFLPPLVTQKLYKYLYWFMLVAKFFFIIFLPEVFFDARAASLFEIKVGLTLLSWSAGAYFRGIPFTRHFLNAFAIIFALCVRVNTLKVEISPVRSLILLSMLVTFVSSLWTLKFKSHIKFLLENILIPEAKVESNKQYTYTSSLFDYINKCNIDTFSRNPQFRMSKLNPGLQLQSLKRYNNCGIAAIQIKSVDILSALLEPPDFYSFISKITSIIDSSIVECGLIKVTQFSGVILVVSLQGLDGNTHGSGHLRKIVEFNQKVRWNIDQYNRQNEFLVSVGIGLHVGSIFMGLLGNVRYCFDISGRARDMVCAMAMYQNPNPGCVIFASQGLSREFSYVNAHHDPISKKSIKVMFRNDEILWTRFDPVFVGVNINKDFDYLKKIGEGGYGMVALLREKATGIEYAVKSIPIRRDVSWWSKLIEREFTVLQKLDHPNVVKFLFCMKNETRMFLVMTYVNCGNLLEIVVKNSPTIEQMKYWFKQLVNAISHVHSLNIIHRDVKPSNCLIGNDGDLKLCDFGLSKIIVSTPSITNSNNGDDICSTVSKKGLSAIKTLFPLTKNTRKTAMDSMEILLIDDLMSTTRNNLTTMYYTVTHVQTVKMALEKATSEFKFDIIFIHADNLKLTPQNSGGVITLMKSSFPKVPIVVICNAADASLTSEWTSEYGIITINSSLNIDRSELFAIARDRPMESLDDTSYTTSDTEKHEVMMDYSTDIQKEFLNENSQNNKSSNAMLDTLQEKSDTLGKSHSNISQSTVGTLHFMAPEAFQMQKYGKAIDWWACGVTFYQCATREHLFKGDGKKQIVNEILKAPIDLSLLNSMSPLFENLVSLLLDRNQKTRLTSATAIAKHKFFDPPYITYKPPQTLNPQQVEHIKDKVKFYGYQNAKFDSKRAQHFKTNKDRFEKTLNIQEEEEELSFDGDIITDRLVL